LDHALDLKPQLKEKIREAFYKLKDPEILKPLKADGFARSTTRIKTASGNSRAS